ncbi:unnamed protein product [Mesocestoides corti]|uniref:MPN domain-containing protein n=2 Tax=Mesocestoides corti TaxID=53468 RepID=A0A0R3UKT2_MESCO|nr:unnamed protein product [Mesocestoides corti]
MSAAQRMREINSRVVVDYSATVDLTSYFRMCRSMLVMAKQYETEGFPLRAYVLQKRFLLLFIDHLSKREDYKGCDADVRRLWSRECKRVLDTTEKLHQTILAGFQAQELAEKKAAEEKEKELLRKAEEDKKRQSTALPTTTTTTNPSPSNGAVPPTFDRLLKPSTEKPSTGSEFNPIHVPRSLAATFMKIAEKNTKLNVETCATLCGRLGAAGGSGLIVSHIILCKQVGTADCCTTAHEEELLECMDANCLIALGWIHTHPTQEAFMSSVDLHCQLSYQLMLPEAIAIVCSAKYNDVQYFSLTPDYGIKFLRECQQTGFHKHASTRDLYMKSPHVVFTDDPVAVFDLR